VRNTSCIATVFLKVARYSLKHKNIALSTFFYKYNITWYDSKVLTQMQNSFNSYGGMVFVPRVSPSIDYRPQGLDCNFVFGKDIVHKSENDFIGLGLMLGISLPWIDSEKSSSNDDSLSDDLMDAMQSSKTKILTYKVGPNISLSKGFGKYISIYASATYAYQTGTMQNDYVDTKFTVDGIFEEYDAGVKIEPFAYDHKFGWFTLSPRLYATFGYRYSSWVLNDIALDITGANLNFAATDFTMKLLWDTLVWDILFKKMQVLFL